MSNMNRSRRRRNKNKTEKIFLDEETTDCGKSDAVPKEETVYQIQRSNQLGRYLAAKRDILAGEMIMNDESPLAVGPVQQSMILCLGCYEKIIDLQNSRCDKCKWPLCGLTCEGLYKDVGHTLNECKLLTQISFEEHIRLDNMNAYNFIVPLRCLLLKKVNPSKWQQITSMEAQNQIRRKIPSIWQFNEVTVVQKLKDYFSKEEIHTICGVLEVNCFEVSVSEVSLRALYPKAFLMSHNCVPNTMHTNDNEFKLKIRASIRIPKGEPITISYAYTLLGTAKRRAHVKETKFFECSCNRCADPNELGSNMSSINCDSCCQSTMISSSPLNPETFWICRNKKCESNSLTQSHVDELLQRLENDLQQISENDIESYENWIKKASKYLHVNHYMIVGVKYTLSLLYGKINGYMIQQMDDNLLKRKIKLCEDLLDIAKIVEPGFSRLRGIILYELQASLMMLIQRGQLRCASRKHMKLSMQRVISCLRESSDILSFESSSTMEGKIGLAAYQALLTTHEWENLLS